jgi:hypothetical protein
MSRKEGETADFWQRLDYLRHLTAQAVRERYIVIYAAAGKRPVSAFIDTGDLPLPFVARDRTFWASFADAREAYYVTAFLNSDYVAASIRDFMNRGLFGPRDINLRAVDVPFPAFSEQIPDHCDLAYLALTLTKQATTLLRGMPTRTLGRMRSRLRESLDAETLAAIEVLVRRIAT